VVIIQLAGGLGNQMFQYALYLQLKSLGKTVKIDERAGFAEDEKRGPILSLFGIDYERATAKELECMLDSSPLLHNKIRRKLRGRKKKSYFEADKRYKPEIMEWDDIYLEGYWQTEKYFQDVTQRVREAYDTDCLLESLMLSMSRNGISDKCNKAGKESGTGTDKRSGIKEETLRRWLEKIASAESVSLHVRRGDYLLPQNQALFGGICTEAYYIEAMKQMRQNHPGCRFYLFTNEKAWAMQKTENIPDMEVVDVGGLGDYVEFVLMSKCRHNILANSSYSWWASYLNKNPDKTVLAPDRWLNGWDCEDIYRADMQRIRI